MNDVSSFINSVKNLKEKTTYFKDENENSKKRCKKYKTLISILESVDTVVNIGPTTISVTLSVTGIGLIVVLSSAGIACSLSLANRILLKMILN